MMSEYEIHKYLCDNLHELYNIKNERYGSSAKESFKRFGDTSTAIRLHDKFMRYLTLIENKNLDSLDESIDDTLIDLANYSLMAVMYRKMRKEGKL